MIGLPRSTYYRRMRGVAADTVDPDATLRAAITEGLRAFPGYGYRRVTRELRRRNQRIYHKKVQRVMQTMLLPPAPRRRPWLVAEPDEVSGSWYPNRRAGMVPTRPSQLWVADITYVRLERGFVFLAVVIEVFSRKVIGYAIGPHSMRAFRSPRWMPPLSSVGHPRAACTTQTAGRNMRPSAT